jgi:hypothetical protein
MRKRGRIDMKRGDRVIIECDGKTVPGIVLLASENDKSLMLSFDALIDGHVGMMPVLQNDDGEYRSIMTDVLVKLQYQPKGD